AEVGAAEHRLRRRKVSVDVRDAVYVLGIEELGRAREPPGQALVDRDVAAPQLRELEVGVGERELEARRGCARRRGLVRIGVRVERVVDRRVMLYEPGEHPGVADLIGYPHVRGAAGEDACAASDLGVLLAVQ